MLDDLITLGDVATETRGDEFHITATFTNTSDTAIGNPFFEVADLTGGNLLVNADAGPGGPGATLSPESATASCHRANDNGELRHRSRHTRGVQLPRERQGARGPERVAPHGAPTGPTATSTHPLADAWFNR